MTRAELLAYIDSNVYPNANNEITALMVRDVLHHMVGFLGDAATYGVGDVALNNGGLVTGGAVQDAINTTLSSAIMFQGVTTTPLTDGSTNPTITIDGESYTARRGDEVIYGGREYLWTGSKWQQLGDEESWAAKTITIFAGTGLTGGGNLTQNRTISLSQDSLEKLALADTVAGYFTNAKLNLQNLPDLYVARTQVSGTAANKTLYGVDGISHAAAADNTDKSRIVWDADNDAWHFYGNIYTDGWYSGGGISPGGGGGGGGGIDPVAMWRLLTNNPSLTQYDNYTKISADHINFPVTSVVGLTGAVSAAQIAAALGLGSLAYQSTLYIGTTAVQSTSQQQDLTGIGAITMANNKQFIIADSGGTARQIMIMSSANALQIGYGMNDLSSGGGVALYGKTLTIYTGADRTNALSISASQTVTFSGDARFGNAHSISFLDNPSSGTASHRNVLDLSTNNRLRFGHGTRLIYNTDVYGYNIYFYTVASGVTTARYVMDGASIRPFVASSYDLGSSTYKWRNAYIDTIYENGTALSSKYLALAGGTMTGDISLTRGKYIVDLTTGNALAGVDSVGNILFGYGYNSSNTGVSAYIRTGNKDILHRKYSAVGTFTDEKVLDSSNYGSYALPLSGGTMSGAITLKQDQFSGPSGNHGLNANNSDIVGLNSLYTKDLADDMGEGIHFYRSSGYWDSLTSSSGTLYYYPNRPESTIAFSGAFTVYHSGNSNKSDVAWEASSLTLHGAISGATNINSLLYFRSGGAYFNKYFYSDISFSNYPALGSLATNNIGLAVCHWSDSLEYGLYATTDRRTGNSILQVGAGIDSDANAYNLSLQPRGGNVAIGKFDTSYKLDVDGVIHASTGIYTDGWFSGGGLASSSDRRLKKNIKNFAYTPKLLLAIRPREWDWKDGSAMVGHAAGFVAQEIEPVMPYAVDGTRNIKALFYDRFHALEISALQDHERRIKALEDENEKIRRENIELKKRLNMN